MARSLRYFRQVATWRHAIPGRPSMDILIRSWQDLAKILEKSKLRSWQELQDVMVRSYQESHVPKKTFIVKSCLERK